MLAKIFTVVCIGLIIIHGLIHLVGFRIYGQGMSMEKMQFKTTFLNGALDLGASGTRVYGMLWLLPAIGFIVSGLGLSLHAGWWQPVAVASALVSILLTGMDWSNAIWGMLIDLGLLAAMLFAPLAARFGIAL